MNKTRLIKSSILISIIVSFFLIDTLEAQYDARSFRRKHRALHRKKMNIDNVISNLEDLSERSIILQENTLNVEISNLNKISDDGVSEKILIKSDLNEMAKNISNLVKNIKRVLEDESILENRAKKNYYIYFQYDVESVINHLEDIVKRLNKFEDLDN